MEQWFLFQYSLIENNTCQLYETFPFCQDGKDS